MTTPIERAIAACGGSQKALGVAIGESKSFVNQWVKGVRPIPERCCPLIEAQTGVRCEELRNDVEWVRNPKGKVVGYHVPLRQKVAA